MTWVTWLCDMRHRVAPWPELIIQSTRLGPDSERWSRARKLTAPWPKGARRRGL